MLNEEHIYAKIVKYTLRVRTILIIINKQLITNQAPQLGIGQAPRLALRSYQPCAHQNQNVYHKCIRHG